MNRVLTKQLLLSNNYWVLNKTLVQKLGLETAFLVSHFAEAETMMGDQGGWFYQTSETVEKMTTLSRHKQDICIKQLEEMGILEKDVRGMPAKRYFRLNYNSLTNLFVENLQTGMSKINKQVCKKSATNKERTNKESIDKESIVSGGGSRLTKEMITEIVDQWNKLGLQNLRAINSNTKRHTSLKARIEEYSYQEVLDAISRINKSSFLRGQNPRGWTITFDWLVRPNNFLKVIEGNYDDNDGKGGGSDGPGAKQTTKEDAQDDDIDWAARAGVHSF